MGVKVQLDQNCLRSSASNKSGLLLGTTTHHLRIFYLVPTPSTPPGTSPHRWAVEHANILRPMFPGGLSILGTYLPLRGNSASPSKDIDSAAAIARDITALSGSSCASLVLCRGPKGRVVVKQIGFDESDHLKTADLKEVSHLTNNVISIRATLSIPPTLFPIMYNFTTPTEFKSACYSIVDALASNVFLQLPDELHTVVTCAGDSRNLAETMGWRSDITKSQKQSSFSHSTIDVQLLAPVCIDCDQDTSTEASTENGVKLTSLRGSVHLEAVATLDATIGDVLSALQVDLVQSLRARADLLVESNLPDEDDSTRPEAQWDQASISAFPARVVASPVADSFRFLSLTEYLMPEESIDDDLMIRFMEAFSWDEKRLEEFKVEQKERFHLEQSGNGDKADPLALRTSEPSITENRSNSAIDIPSIMQTSLLAAFILGFLAILIKEILTFL